MGKSSAQNIKKKKIFNNTAEGMHWVFAPCLK